MPRARDFQPTLTGLHVLVTGDLVNGFQAFGPFKTRPDAEQYGNQRGDRLGDDSWVLLPLAAPDFQEGRLADDPEPVCESCGRPEADCSAEPCQAVLDDRADQHWVSNTRGA
jgi:hypothetical protein